MNPAHCAYHAERIAAYMNAAVFLGTAQREQVETLALRNLNKLAAAMGYTLTPIPDAVKAAESDWRANGTKTEAGYNG